MNSFRIWVETKGRIDVDAENIADAIDFGLSKTERFWERLGSKQAVMQVWKAQVFNTSTNKLIDVEVPPTKDFTNYEQHIETQRNLMEQMIDAVLVGTKGEV